MAFSISFWGSPPIAARFLEKLLADERFSVKFVVTQKDKARSSRNRILLPTPVKEVAQKAGILVFEPETLRTEIDKINQETQKQKISCHVVFAYGKMIPEEIFSQPPQKSVNFHASLLPKLRGASPIETALLLDLPKTGWSLQQIAQSLDSGKVFSQVEVPIYPEDDCRSLMARLELVLLEKGRDMLYAYLMGKTHGFEQDEKEASYCKKILPEDMRLNFTEDIRTVRNKARAFSARGGLFAFFDGKRVKFEPNFYSLAYEQNTIQGEVGSLVLKPKPGIIFADGIFYLNKLQREGGRWLTVEEFYNGYARKKTLKFT